MPIPRARFGSTTTTRCEMRKYDFDPASNGFKLERRVMGPNLTASSHFYWMPDAPPTQAWTLADFFVRNDADFGSDGLLTNQRATSATYQLTPVRRPYPHFCKVGDHVYATFADTTYVYEQVGDGWAPRFAFGGNTAGKREARTPKLSPATPVCWPSRENRPPIWTRPSPLPAIRIGHTALGLVGPQRRRQDGIHEGQSRVQNRFQFQLID